MRSSPRRSARRLSPYGAKPPPTTELSGALGGIVLDSGPRSGGRRGRANFGAAVKELTSVSAPVTFAGSRPQGPIARQQRKEVAWTAKGTSNLWDASDKLLVGDPAHATQDTPESAVDPSRLWTLVRGRVEARAQQREIDAWKSSAIDDFLASSEEKPARRRRRQRASSSTSLPPLVPPPASSGFHHGHTWPEPKAGGSHSIASRREGCELLSPGFSSRPRLPALRKRPERQLDSRAELHRRVNHACDAIDRIVR